MKATVPINASDTHQSTRLIMGLTCRNLIDGDVANVFHKMAWLLTPRHIPKDDMGKRSRKGHNLLSGRINTSDA